MRSDIDPNVFHSEVFQLRDDLSNSRKAFSDERLTTIILDALPKEMYFKVKMQSLRDPKLGLEEITKMTKTMFINHALPKEMYSKVKLQSLRDPKLGLEEIY